MRTRYRSQGNSKVSPLSSLPENEAEKVKKDSGLSKKKLEINVETVVMQIIS